MRLHAAHAFAGVLLIVACAALPASAAVWTVDKAHSKISFDSAYGPTKFTGSFGAWSASINFDPNNLPASKAVVTVDLASALTGDDDRDQSLPTPDWFSTAKFPKATFTTTSIKRVGPDKYQAAAVLSLRGVSKPAVLNFTLKIVGNQATMNGQATLDRSQWGVGQGQFADDKPVPHAVVVNVSLSAKAS